MVEQFQSASTKHSRVESLEDMRRFVLEHSDFQKLQVGARMSWMQWLQAVGAVACC